jgi:hypothetical protein
VGSPRGGRFLSLKWPTGYEDAVLGVASRLNDEFVVLDFEKSIEITMNLCDCDREGAIDYFYFNVIGSMSGEAYLVNATIEEITESAEKD